MLARGLAPRYQSVRGKLARKGAILTNFEQIPRALQRRRAQPTLRSGLAVLSAAFRTSFHHRLPRRIARRACSFRIHLSITTLSPDAAAEALPFPEAKFDAVLSTVMLHHLSRKARERCAAEMRRVVKPGGRVLAVEFGSSARHRKGVLARLHRHGRVELRDVVALLSEAGLVCIDSGAVGIGDMHFVLAIAPGRI